MLHRVTQLAWCRDPWLANLKLSSPPNGFSLVLGWHTLLPVAWNNLILELDRRGILNFAGSITSFLLLAAAGFVRQPISTQQMPMGNICFLSKKK